MNHEPDFDPEAVALGRVYALLIRAARQQEAKQKRAAEQAIDPATMAAAPLETAPRSAGSRKPAPASSFQTE
ncbi:MAG: hypothetical protein DHS20C20_32920 [Ardenticatenaceae bacterium]|nr:MAG: hypothetical protein DHS20C20_32920 [Ardenticatenaceae bacterium]